MHALHLYPAPSLTFAHAAHPRTITQECFRKAWPTHKKTHSKKNKPAAPAPAPAPAPARAAPARPAARAAPPAASARSSSSSELDFIYDRDGNPVRGIDPRAMMKMLLSPSFLQHGFALATPKSSLRCRPRRRQTRTVTPTRRGRARSSGVAT